MSDENLEWDGEEFTTVDDMFAEWKKREEARNFVVRWIDNKLFPNGIAGYRATHSLTHPWKIVNDMGREVKYAWQRVFTGYDERIYWSIDQWLSEILVEVLPIFKTLKIGVPIGMFPPDLQMEDSTDEDFEKAKIKYNLIIDKITRSFQLHLSELVDVYIPTEEERKEQKEGMELFIEYLGSLWD